MITLSHPTGNSFVRHALRALDQAGQLDSFYTTLAFPPSIPVQNLRRRSYSEIPASKIHTRPWLEALRLMGAFKGQAGVDRIYRDLDKYVARQLPKLKKRGVTGVYAYEDGASEIFAAAKKIGLQTLYDLPIGHHVAAQKIFKEEAQLNPEWASTLTGLDDSAEKLARKSSELKQADKIIVASSFTASTLQGHLAPHQELCIIPYGAPSLSAPAQTISPDKRLKVLYVGSLGQRKGISYLFDAVAALPRDSYTLTLVGRPVVELSSCEILCKSLAAHTHIPTLPHAQILELMHTHDVLVFPSLFEGFGLVLTEALACGLPIISTAHTAAPDLIADGKEGFIVPLRSAQAITQKLVWMMEHPQELQAMRQAAYAKAQQCQWQAYERSILKACVGVKN